MSAAIKDHLYRDCNAGNYYLVLHVGVHTKTKEEMVVYIGINTEDEKVWIEHKEDFEETFEDISSEITEGNR